MLVYLLVRPVRQAVFTLVSCFELGLNLLASHLSSLKVIFQFQVIRNSTSLAIKAILPAWALSE